jgi:ribosomal protein S20
MPIIKSAKKRVRVARKASVRNSKTKRNLKNAFKLFAKSPSAKTASAAQSAVGKAAKKHVIHKNKAARLQSQAAKRAKAAGVKPAKKTATKAAPAKKAPAKKPAAKKAPAKKK